MTLPVRQWVLTCEPDTISGTTVYDQGSSGNDATLAGSPTTGTPAIVEGTHSITYAGINQICTAPMSGLGSIDTSKVAAGVICRFDASGGEYIPFSLGISIPSSAWEGWWVERYTDNQIIVVLEGGSSLSERIHWTGIYVSEGDWVGIVITWDGTDMVCHVHDGVTTQSSTYTPPATTLQLNASSTISLPGYHNQIGGRVMVGPVEGGWFLHGSLPTQCQIDEYFRTQFRQIGWGGSESYILRIAGIGDASDGQWRFVSSKPYYGGCETREWLTEWPTTQDQRVDLDESSLRISDAEVGVLDAEHGVSGSISSTIGSSARPVCYLSENISSADTAFSVSLQSATSDGDVIWVGNEAMLRGADSGGDITVTRAYLGTDAQSWSEGTPVYASMRVVGGAKATLHEAPVGSTDTSQETLIGEYSVSALQMTKGSEWRISLISRMAMLTRPLCSMTPATSVLQSISNGVLNFVPMGDAGNQGNPYSLEASLWPEGAYILLDDEAIRVDTHEDPFALTIKARGQCGTKMSDGEPGATIRMCLAADYGSFSSFRYSSSNSTTRASGWSASTHWVDIILCLLTSSAHPSDGLELVNGDATYGNWSCLNPGWGAGIPVSRFNLSTFDSVKNRTFGWGIDGYVLEPEQIPAFDAVRAILRAVGAIFRMGSDGRIELVLPQPILRSESPTSITTADVISAHSASIDLISQIASVDVVCKAYTGGDHTESISANDTPVSAIGYYGSVSSSELEAPISVAGIPGWLRRRAALLAVRLAVGRWSAELVCASGVSVLPGDQVQVTLPGLPSPVGGVGWTSQNCIVTGISRTFGPNESVGVTVETSEPTSAELAPSGVIASVASLDVTLEANVFSSGSESDLVSVDAEGFEVGDIIALRFADGSVVSSDTAEITAISGNIITLDNTMSGNLVAGRIVVLAPYADSASSARTRSVWVADEANMNVSSGVSPDVWGAQ